MKLPVLVLLTVMLPGCGAALLNTPVTGRSARWEIDVRGVTDGPDSMGVGVFRYVPDDGDRFLHVTVTLRNVGAERRKWNWARCGLDLGDQQYLPRFVMLDMVVYAQSEGSLELDPGEQVDRQIVFPYPQGPALPTRLTCGEVVVPLQLRPS